MTEKRFSWEYSHYDSTGEIYDGSRQECLITDYLQKYEIEEWCQELNKIVGENEQLKKENRELQEFKDKVFNLIDKTIESETQIAENIESTIEGDYVKAVNRLTIIAFENLKKELSE